MSILELLHSVDDFWQQERLSSGQRKRIPLTWMQPSEIMIMVILFQQLHYRTFKAYVTQYVHRHLHSEFPT